MVVSWDSRVFNPANSHIAMEHQFFFNGNFTISMAIVNSYVKLPGGDCHELPYHLFKNNVMLYPTARYVSLCVVLNDYHRLMHIID